jgi:hypothetical protein
MRVGAAVREEQERSGRGGGSGRCRRAGGDRRRSRGPRPGAQQGRRAPPRSSRCPALPLLRYCSPTSEQLTLGRIPGAGCWSCTLAAISAARRRRRRRGGAGGDRRSGAARVTGSRNKVLQGGKISQLN